MQPDFEWKGHISAGRVEKAIVSYVLENDWAIFSDFVQQFAFFMPTTGKVKIRAAPNVLLWWDLSPELAQAIGAVLGRGEIRVEQVPRTLYTSAMGWTSPYPVHLMKGPPPTVESWYPVCLRLGSKGD